MSKSINMCVRVDPELKEQAEAILDQLGMNMNGTINMFLNQIVREKRVPLSLSLNPEQNVLSDIDCPDRKYFFLHMELKASHDQVGSIGYTVTDETPAGKLVHLGYFTYPRFWGNGYTSEALKKVLEYAFTVDNVYRVTTGCLAENVGSERVMQKNGMIQEAEHLDYEWHDGKMKTRLEYRLLRHEWEKNN